MYPSVSNICNFLCTPFYKLCPFSCWLSILVYGSKNISARNACCIINVSSTFSYILFFKPLRVNGAMRFKDQPEWLSMLIAGFANSLGLMLIIIIQYSVYFNTGTVFWTTNWLSVNLLFGIVPMMFILPYFNRIFFRMTGRVYLGPLVTCLVFIMILSTNTVVYLPIN